MSDDYFLTEQEMDRNRAFSRWVASLPTVEQVIGQYADGTVITVTVPSMFA